MTSKSVSGGAVVKQSERKAAHRAAILDAAEQVLARCGEGMSIEAIAYRAGLAKGTIYNHFADKETLLRAVARRIRETAAERVAGVVRDIEDAPSRIAAGMNVYLSLAREDPNRGTILARMIQDAIDPAASINAALFAEIERGNVRGELCAHPTRAGVVAVLALVQASINLATGSFSRSSDADAASALVNYAIAALTAGTDKCALSG